MEIGAVQSADGTEDDGPELHYYGAKGRNKGPGRKEKEKGKEPLEKILRAERALGAELKITMSPTVRKCRNPSRPRRKIQRKKIEKTMPKKHRKIEQCKN